MMPPKPRIIVSRANFDQEESVKDLGSRTSTVESEEFEIPRTVPKAEPAAESSKQTLLQYVTAWATELIWCLLSVILLMGLVMVLSTFDNRPLPKLPLGLTLNTIVAILATASRAVTVFLIGQGISQMKWNQYVGTERPLINLHVFDEASRGPWGSLQMVFRSRGNFLAFLASFLIISSLASSTLTQSAIAYIPRLVAEERLVAKAQLCNSFPCGGSYTNNSRDVRGFLDNLEASAFGAVFSNVNQKLAMTAPRCQSADCSWSHFDTLAVCYEMKNVTENLTVNITRERPILVEEQVNTASLMSGKAFLREVEGIGLGGFNVAVNITSLEPNLSFITEDGDGDLSFPYPRKSVGFEDRKDLLNTTFSQFLFVFNNLDTSFEKPEKRYRAVEVLMHFCVQTLEVKVDQGEPKTRAIKSYTNVTRVNAATVSLDGVGESAYYEMSSQDQKVKFKLLEYLQLDQDLRQALSGFYTARSTSEPLQTGEMTKQIGLKMFRDVGFVTPGAEADEKVWKNLEGVISTIATGMSNHMREAGLDRDGTALTSVTFVEVRWEWMTLVSAQVGLSIVFLLSVMYGTARLGVDVVKSSNMAELFAFSTTERQDGWKEGESHGAYQDVGHAGIKTQVAKDVGATLRKGREGWFMEVKPRLMDA
ncbi:hypothetical protein CC79DRAFT_194693 [Sarocladium strictum]